MSPPAEFEERLLSSVPEGWTAVPDVPPVVNSSLNLVLYVASMTLPAPDDDPEAEPEVRTCPVSNDRLGPEYRSLGGFVCGADPGLWACVASNHERRQWEWQSQRMSEEIRWLLVNGERKVDLGKGQPYVSRDGLRVAYTQTLWDDATGIFRARVVVGADEGPFFQAVEPAGFGADGSFAYRAFDGVRWGVVRGGKGKGPYQNVPELRWSPDGLRLAYVAVTEEGARVIVDGEKGALHEGARELRFSPDGLRVAYVASAADGDRVVVDGVAGALFPRVGSLGFSADGRAVVGVIATGGGWTVTVNDQAGPVYDEVGPPVCGRGGERTSYAAKKGGRSLAVVGGQESEPCDLVYRLLVGERGGWAHALLQEKTCVLTHNGREVARGTSRPNQMAMSDDGASLAWSESLDGRMRLVVDGKPGEWFDRVESPVYAPDGRTLLYVGRRNGEAWLVAGAALHGPMEPLTAPVFDGRRAAVVARIGREYRRKIVPF
ncbi:MAG TPA: hypothetical protein VF950_06670 [Planctomycetota bacterium]